MTDRAYLHASISLSLQVAELSILGQLLFERMFPHADHQGRLPGHPKKVKALVVPLVDASTKEVEEQLRKMHDLGLIVWYEASGERIIQLVSWWKFQHRRFAHPSKYPAPEGWKDRLRFNDPHNPKILVEENWVGHVPVGRPETDGSKAPIQDAYVGPYVGSYVGAYEGSEIPPSSSSSSSEEDQHPLSPAKKREGTTPLGNGTVTGSEAIPYAEIVAYLNEATGKKFRHTAPKTRSLIRARWGEGFTLRDFEHAIGTKADDWSNDPAMRKFLRPETIFGNKFEGYVNQNPREDDREPDGKGTGGDNGSAIAKDLPPATIAALEEVIPLGKRSYVGSLVLSGLAGKRSLASLHEVLIRERIDHHLVDKIIDPLRVGGELEATI